MTEKLIKAQSMLLALHTDSTINLAVVVNDPTELDASLFTYSLIGLPTAGTSSLSPNGVYTYDSSGVSPGLYTDSYTVTNSNGDVSDPATISIEVTSNDS